MIFPLKWSFHDNIVYHKMFFNAFYICIHTKKGSYFKKYKLEKKFNSKVSN